MVRKLYFILFFFTLLSAKAQKDSLINTEALLWELRHDSIPGASYLFGTMHVQDKRAYQFPDSMLIFLSQCKLFAGELSIEDLKKSANTGMIMLPSDIKLEDLLMKAEYKKVKKLCKKELGVYALLVNKIKPVFTSAMLSESVLKKEMKHALDEYLQYEAKDKGLEVVGLETASEQLSAIETMPYKDQALMLLDEVEHFEETRIAMNKMADWYGNGQLDSLYLVTVGDSAMQGEVGDAMIKNRNVVMASRLEPMLREQRVFCAIGAAHLPGREGVLALLQEKGYRIRPIRRK